jgi:hypothetical protein
MKVEINKNKTEKEIEFPCLMKSDDDVVLFAIGKGDRGYDGCIIKPYKKESPVSGVMKFNYWDEKVFKPFKGSVTLSND